MESEMRSGSESVQEDFDRMSLIDHLEELRHRVVWSVVAVGVAFIAAWTFIKPIAAFLARPVYKVLPGQKLAFLGITDPFIMYVKIAALVGLFVASPVVLYQIWRFIAPGLYRRERRWAAPFVVFGTLFFVGGGAFAYYIAFPFAVEFLVGVGSEFDPVITVDRYFRFLLYVILGLGVMFELPIVIFLLAQMGIVTPRFLIRHFRWAVLLIFVAAAFITPTPDVVNLCLFAVPTIFLYLLGVGAAAAVQWGKKREEKRAAGD
jgi:sec-independent protein translocase protein TatC